MWQVCAGLHEEFETFSDARQRETITIEGKSYRMKDDGRIECLGRGPGTKWQKRVK